MMDILEVDQEVLLSVEHLATTTTPGAQEDHQDGTRILQRLAAKCILEAGAELTLADQVILQVLDLKGDQEDHQHQPPALLELLHHLHTNHFIRRAVAVSVQAMDPPSRLLVLQVVQVQVVLHLGQVHLLGLLDLRCRLLDHDQ